MDRERVRIRVPDCDSTQDGRKPLDGCGSCLYWGKYGGNNACRLKPPVPALVSGPQGPSGLVLYPVTGPDDWCGEFHAGKWQTADPSVS